MSAHVVADHCWHSLEAPTASEPPVSPCLCCRCGATGYREQALAPLAGHGPFYVRQSWGPVVPHMLGECVPSPSIPGVSQ